VESRASGLGVVSQLKAELVFAVFHSLANRGFNVEDAAIT
jgi:hypothetical protein